MIKKAMTVQEALDKWKDLVNIDMPAVIDIPDVGEVEVTSCRMTDMGITEDGLARAISVTYLVSPEYF